MSATPTLPTTYRRAVFEGGGPLALEDVTLKSPGNGELLVKVEACGVCYSDKFTQFGSMRGGPPVCPGHEIIGRVVAVGEGASSNGWKIGDRAGGGWHGGSCDSHCGYCDKGMMHMCEEQVVNGLSKDGGYAEYCILRSEAAARVPMNVDAAEYAPIMCAGVTTFNGLRNSGAVAGDTVAIQGLGGLGHLGVQYANKFGFRVIAISRGTEKEKFARELGAHEYIDSNSGDPGEALKKLGGAKVVVTTAPNAEAMPCLVKGIQPFGKLMLLAVPGPVTFDTMALVKRGVSIMVFPCGHHHDSEDAIKFTSDQKVQCLIQKFPLEKANEAFNAMSDGTVRFRAVITMD